MSTNFLTICLVFFCGPSSSLTIEVIRGVPILVFFHTNMTYQINKPPGGLFLVPSLQLHHLLNKSWCEREDSEHVGAYFIDNTNAYIRSWLLYAHTQKPGNPQYLDGCNTQEMDEKCGFWFGKQR